MNNTRHRALTTGAVAVSAALAIGIGVQLSGYGVPVALLLACCLSCMATFSSLLFRVIGAWSTTTHRCTRPGCDFHVSLTHADSAETRRWQEIAAHHPHRTH
ncbi:hypothetical protein [Streptomyces sp. IB201691-2A2]|uniref:hypothetical protein n=1 Tax=Streptomyces sp. IB201691-2A2 TaxID=2561920 RepID=UPI00117DFC9E|nr:hypothetical protein [Streptomyces sp. IB201691-2A2]TRO57631.1 hypothetical protein E4K73_41730 [Streptomyces sp. IB201691-2A2]